MKQRRRGASGIVRLFSRLVFGAVAVVVFTLVSIQFARIVNENIAMARSLSSVRQDVAALREHKRQEERELRRLLDPEGAVPEIHDRLHLVRPNEAIIYVKPAAETHE
jgi:cell division protein FtsB